MASAHRTAKRKRRFSKTSAPRNPRNRLLGMLGTFMVIGFAFVAVLVDLQAVRAERFREMGSDQRIANSFIQPVRGDILDSTGFVMAASRPSQNLVADPQRLEDVDLVSSALAPYLEEDPAEVAAALRGTGPDDRYQLLSRQISEELSVFVESQLNGVQSESWSGVYLESADYRAYPGDSIGLGLVGRVDPSQVGVFGVESFFDEIMRGVPGSTQFERNNFGGQISVGSTLIKPAQSGFDVVLTVDHRLQYTTESILIDQCEEQQAEGAAAVVSDAKTGELLALASVGASDEGCEVLRYNKPLVDTYESGSVLKPFVIAEALATQGYSADTVMHLPPSVEVSDKEFFDHPRRDARDFTISQILAESSNVGTITLAKQMGPEAVHSALSRVGIGQASGVDFGAESTGALRSVDDWWGSDMGSIAIGQGVSTTLMQIHNGYAAIANGGVQVRPSVVSHLRSPEGGDLLPEPNTEKVVMDPQIAAEISSALEAVVSEGTGSRAAVQGIQVAGKTGTAWKAYDDGSGKLTYGEPGKRRYATTFAGFAPADDPRFVISVMVDEPEVDYQASLTAAPTFSRILARTLSLYDYDLEFEGVDQNDRVRALPAGDSDV